MTHIGGLVFYKVSTFCPHLRKFLSKHCQKLVPPKISLLYAKTIACAIPTY